MSNENLADCGQRLDVNVIVAEIRDKLAELAKNVHVHLRGEDEGCKQAWILVQELGSELAAIGNRVHCIHVNLGESRSVRVGLLAGSEVDEAGMRLVCLVGEPSVTAHDCKGVIEEEAEDCEESRKSHNALFVVCGCGRWYEVK